jgi:outer membrane immunogenic protein
MLLGLLAASSAMALASAASAADLRLKAPPAPMPMMNWSGFYVGAHIGGTWGTTETEIHSIALGPLALAGFTLPLSSHAFNGFVGGGQIGYNWQSGIVVFGVEGEVSATNARGTGPCVLVLSCKTEQNWVATAAARLGLADGPSLYYVKGGAAWSNNTYSADLNILLGLHTEVQQTRTGWLVGAGIEHAFAGTGLSAKLEYDFIDYGTKDVHFPLAVIVPIDIGAQAREYQHVVKVGVNYRFDYLGWGKGKAPVVAKY